MQHPDTQQPTSTIKAIPVYAFRSPFARQRFLDLLSKVEQGTVSLQRMVRLHNSSFRLESGKRIEQVVRVRKRIA